MRINEADERVQCEANIDLTIEQDLQCMEFNKATAACACEFDGETCNFYGLQRHMQSLDRDERRRAFLKWAELYEQVSPQLDAQFDRLTELRQQMAKRAGFDSYTAMAYAMHHRLDYGPTTCARSASRSSSTSCRCARGCSRSRLSGWAWTSCAITTNR